MLVCIAGLSFGSTTKNQVELESGKEASVVSAFLAIAFGILCPVLFSSGGMTVRVLQERTGYNSTELTAATYVGNNIVLLVAMVLTYQYGSHPFIMSEYLEMIVAGIFAAFGVVSLNYAITIGYAGAVFALANTQVIIQTLLDAYLVGQIPTWIEIISAMIGILGKIYFLNNIGSIIIAVGPEIYLKLTNLVGKGKTE